VVVVGGGFAGFFALHHLPRRLPLDAADLVLVSPDDYLLYSPSLPEVATGVVEARHIAVSLRRALPRVRRVLGRVTAVDLTGRQVTVQRGDVVSAMSWDRLARVPGSVTRRFDIPRGAGARPRAQDPGGGRLPPDHLLEQRTWPMPSRTPRHLCQGERPLTGG
jgi:NADH:quinone reductase (non-electrogenic)